MVHRIVAGFPAREEERWRGYVFVDRGGGDLGEGGREVGVGVLVDNVPQF